MEYTFFFIWIAVVTYTGQNQEGGNSQCFKTVMKEQITRRYALSTTNTGWWFLNKTQTILITKRIPVQVNVCCQGYLNISGICTKIQCPYNKFGEQCVEDCPCIQGNYERCDVNGTCVCYSGWTGENCSKKIIEDYTLAISKSNCTLSDCKCTEVSNNSCTTLSSSCVNESVRRADNCSYGQNIAFFKNGLSVGSSLAIVGALLGVFAFVGGYLLFRFKQKQATLPKDTADHKDDYVDLTFPVSEHQYELPSSFQTIALGKTFERTGKMETSDLIYANPDN